MVQPNWERQRKKDWDGDKSRIRRVTRGVVQHKVWKIETETSLLRAERVEVLSKRMQDLRSTQTFGHFEVDWLIILQQFTQIYKQECETMRLLE